MSSTRQQAKAFLMSGEFGQADKLYRQLLREQPRDADAEHMRGVIALQLGRAQAGLVHIERALALKPGDSRALANLGTAYRCLQRPHDALQAYERALHVDPAFSGALALRASTLLQLKLYTEAAEAFERLLLLAPNTPHALGDFFQARRHGCDWREFSRHASAVETGIAAGQRVDRPFSFLSVSASAAGQLSCARLEAAQYESHAASAVPLAPQPGQDRIRVAYLSADFRDHVVMHLMADIFEVHDRRRFYIVGVALTTPLDTPIVRRARQALDEFIDGSALSDEALAVQLRARHIDIAVDLTGYTEGGRPGVLAPRIAGAQVGFLGFPGTLGATFIDYLIADDFVVPRSAAASVAERVVRLPHCFQAANPRNRLLTDMPAPTRHEVGLPEGGVVLCSFNASYKLNPAVFDIWARVLQAVPGSVLWLLREGAAMEARLRSEAAARGLHAGRLVLADRLPYARHLARLSLADLFLDTLPFNAGATASDALAAGVPVLTCTGEAFASRMAGSALRALGLEELITHDAQGYERLAIALAAEPARLASLRECLAANRETHALFDTARYCRHLETAYLEMCHRWHSSLPPADIDVS